MGISKLLAGKSLVIFQICLSLLLLVGAGLFIRTLANLKSADLGFHPERVLLFTVDPPRTTYAGEKRKALYLELEEQIQKIPGVQSATLSQDALVADNTSTTSFTLPGRDPRSGDADSAWINWVGDHFFETMGIPILYGRPLGVRDRANSPLAGVVNQQFVRKFFPTVNPVGKKIVNGNNNYQIVGICGDARFDQIRSPVPPTFYGAFTQAHDLRNMTFELKAAASEGSILQSVRAVIRSADKDLPVFDIRTQAEQIDATLSHERLFAALASGFGLLALLLSAVGIYGVLAYAVGRRTSEIGVRVALGAQRVQVVTMILREAAGLAAAGFTIGILASVGLTHYIRGMLYDLTPLDPVTFCGAIWLLLLVVLAAGWLPARRASRLDPMITLRHE